MKHFWMVLSGAGILIAAIFMWRREFDRAFVAAALGLVAWFLNYRAQMRAITAVADERNETNDGSDRDKGDEEDEEE